MVLINRAFCVIIKVLNFCALIMKIIKKIQKQNLIGHGCNSFPTADKWKIVRQAKGKVKYVICNISESEPGVFKDRYILENHLEKVIDGIVIAGEYIKAEKGFIYINPEYYKKFIDRINAIIEENKLNIEVYKKPRHDYVGGEETALINSMEGKRIEPRLKPPFPTIKGFEDAPTLVNNCETFYSVSLINSGEYKNERFYCLTDEKGDEKVLELPIDWNVKKVLEEFGYEANKNYFYQVGGKASGKCYNYRQLVRKFEGIPAIIIYRKDIPEKDLVLDWINYFVKESCGQCVPCREGTYRMREILEGYYLSGKEIDQEKFDNLVLTLQNASLCPVGKVSMNAILSYWKNVRDKN